MQVKNDISLDIATGISRKAKTWKNVKVMWSALLDKLSVTTKTPETVAEYKAMGRSQQSEIKDVGGFVGGYCDNGRRTQVRYRSVLCLDADFATAGLWDDWDMLYGNAAAVYSTHKHTPEKPRLRLVIPMSRTVDPDEYQAIGRKIASVLGIDQFDDTSYQPERLMYWPSTSQDGDFVFRYCDGPILDPDVVLDSYVDWRDISAWPFSSRADKAVQKTMSAKQADPLSKPGLVGAFCRAYSIEEAIEKFVPSYQPCGDGRYTFVEGSTAAGVVTYDHKFSFSHHGTDPASGHLCNAWDLVRIHQFRDMDAEAALDEKTQNLPSYNAMRDLVTKDPLVAAQIVADRVADDFSEDPDLSTEEDVAWRSSIKVTGNGTIAPTIDNAVKILENDPATRGCLAYNELSNSVVVLKDLPWRKVKGEGPWSDMDDSQLRNWMQKRYELSGKDLLFDAVNVTADNHRFHPIREYLNSCGWDGVNRVETLLIDYLGAEDTDYVRTVTRKTLVAAVARVMHPGCKFDYMLTLQGVQGKGKSTLFRKLAGKWYSDTVNTFTGKDSYEQARGIWIGEVGELAGMRKSEVDDIKNYLSKQEDRYRPAYGRRVGEYPRQCIFVGTTNETQFLRDATGNRRFWVVEVPNRPKRDMWEDLTPEVVKQIWGEAMNYYLKGEPLRLSVEMELKAKEVQDSYEEENPRIGIVSDFLDRLLPEDWENKSVIDRRTWLESKENKGTVARTTVCTYEIWTEALNQNPDKLDRLAIREVRDIMAKLPQWRHQGNQRITFGPYGRQRYFAKEEVTQ